VVGSREIVNELLDSLNLEGGGEVRSIYQLTKYYRFQKNSGSLGQLVCHV
jgi:hypothetical protein